MSGIMISIIIPVYNAESTIARCLDSAVKQDVVYKEIICIDDGSTDSSVEIVKKYQKHNPEIILLQQENKGAGIARNVGIDHATGEYISFLDADDVYYDPAGLSKMINHCREAGSPVCAGICMINRCGEISELKQFAYVDAAEDEDRVIKVSNSDFQYDYAYQEYVFSRDFLNRNQLRFPDYRRYQDPPFLAKALFLAGNFVATSVKIYEYSENPTSVSRSFRQVCDTLKGMRDNIKLGCDNNLQILCDNTIKRLDNNFYGLVKTSIEDGNTDAVKMIFEIQDILKAYVFSKDKEIALYSWIRKCLAGGGGNGDEFMYRFPYEKIEYGSRVILYGAGFVGRNLKNIIELTHYCELVLWVDKRFEEEAICKMGVRSPEAIMHVRADYILIAVEKAEVFEEIRREISDALVANKNLIVGPVEKIFRNDSGIR